MALRRRRTFREDEATRLRALVADKPERYVWAVVVLAMIRKGWSPPAPSGRALERLIDDIGIIGGAQQRDNERPHLHVSASLDLSPMEQRCLEMAAEGASYAEIAHEFGVSPETVKTRLVDVYRQLGARNVKQAISIGFRRGLLT